MRVAWSISGTMKATLPAEGLARPRLGPDLHLLPDVNAEEILFVKVERHPDARGVGDLEGVGGALDRLPQRHLALDDRPADRRADGDPPGQVAAVDTALDVRGRQADGAQPHRRGAHPRLLRHPLGVGQLPLALRGDPLVRQLALAVQVGVGRGVARLGGDQIGARLPDLGALDLRQDLRRGGSDRPPPPPAGRSVRPPAVRPPRSGPRGTPPCRPPGCRPRCGPARRSRP